MVLFNKELVAVDSIRASRTGVDGALGSCGPPIPHYTLSGSQSGEVEVLEDPKVYALDMVSVEATANMKFVATNIPVETWAWVYAPGDTGGIPAVQMGWNPTGPATCLNQKRCLHTVTANGRMYLRLANGFGGWVFYPSPIVRV
jgi:hypothetical protein